MTTWIILAVLIAAVLAGLRWVYRMFLGGGVVEPTSGIGPYRRPYIDVVNRVFQDREDDAKKEGQ